MLYCAMEDETKPDGHCDRPVSPNSDFCYHHRIKDLEAKLQEVELTEKVQGWRQTELMLEDAYARMDTMNEKLSVAIEALELYSDLIYVPERNQDDEWYEKRDKAHELYLKLGGKHE